MSFTFPMPEIGEGVLEGEIVEWKVSVGDVVTEDQPLCDIMTDKANVEISSPRAGTIVKLYGEPGSLVKVHAPLVDLGDAGAAAPLPKADPRPKPSPAPATITPQPSAPPASNGPTKATPAVRRHAREAAVNIHEITGTGPQGRVVHADIAAFTAPAPKRAPALAQVHPSGHEERVKIIGLRRKIAAQMSKSKATAAHFTYVEEVDATKLVAVRSTLKGLAAERGVKLTYMAFFMKACSVAFRTFPNLNAVMDEEDFALIVKGDHNIGFAVDTPQGLYVPVIHNVEQKSLLQIAAELSDLAERTRAGKATMAELTGSTFTITSVGNKGVLATPVINVPEVAILGVNAIRDQAVVIDGKVEVRKRFYLSPSFDHRVIDGAVAARFVDRLKDLLEAPERLLLELS